jgi:hypothetical protein
MIIVIVNDGRETRRRQTRRRAAEAGIAAFKVGFERWVDDPKRRKMEHHLREAMRGLGMLVRETAAGGRGLLRP